MEKSFIERLPVELDGKDGEKYFLRIKKRKNGKRWCVRYIRKVDKTDKRIAGWRYRTEIQAWGMTLEKASENMARAMLIHGFRKEANKMLRILK